MCLPKTNKSILLRETIFERWERGDVMQERFQTVSKNQFFKNHCQKTLLGRKEEFYKNIILGQTCYLNLDKFGTGNNVSD